MPLHRSSSDRSDFDLPAAAADPPPLLASASTSSTFCKVARLFLATIGFALAAGNAAADPYPSKPITIVVPFSAGSGTDLIARGMARTIPEDWHGSTVVIDNKPGASGIIAAVQAEHHLQGGGIILITDGAKASKQGRRCAVAGHHHRHRPWIGRGQSVLPEAANAKDRQD